MAKEMVSAAGGGAEAREADREKMMTDFAGHPKGCEI